METTSDLHTETVPQDLHDDELDIRNEQQVFFDDVLNHNDQYNEVLSPTIKVIRDEIDETSFIKTINDRIYNSYIFLPMELMQAGNYMLIQMASFVRPQEMPFNSICHLL